MDEEQTYQLIERYLAGELEGDELQEFEVRLGQDSKLRGEVDLARELNEVIEDEKGMAFSALVVEVEEEYLAEHGAGLGLGRGFEEASAGPDAVESSGEPESAEEEEGSGEAENGAVGSKVRRFPTWMAIAASVVLLAVVGYFTVLQGGADPAELYSEYYSDYPAPDAFRGDSSLVERYEVAFEDYKSGKYQSAQEEFESILVVNPDDRMAIFYSGLSYQAAGSLEEAVSHLEQVAGGEYNSYQQAARWYLGLNFVKQEKIEEGKKWLELLAEGKGKYPELAGELLGELD